MRALSPTNGLTAFLLLLATTPINAKLGLEGCTSYETTVTHKDYGPYLSLIYYVPDTLEICTIRDCGGGRAPVKTDVPGCAAYKGTETPETPEPSFLDSDPAAVPSTTSVSSTMGTIVITRDPTTTATATSDTSSEVVSEDESKTETDSAGATSSSVAEETTRNGTAVPGPSQTEGPGSAAGKIGVGLSLIVGAALGAAIVV